MPRTRQTVDRNLIVERANAMLAHLAESGTREDAIRREAIAAIVDSILLGGNSYKGFRYLDRYTAPDGKLKPVTDNTRIAYY